MLKKVNHLMLKRLTRLETLSVSITSFVRDGRLDRIYACCS